MIAFLGGDFLQMLKLMALPTAHIGLVINTEGRNQFYAMIWIKIKC